MKVHKSKAKVFDTVERKIFAEMMEELTRLGKFIEAEFKACRQAKPAEQVGIFLDRIVFE
jgi:hypothetical protein